MPFTSKNPVSAIFTLVGGFLALLGVVCEYISNTTYIDEEIERVVAEKLAELQKN